MLWLLLFAHTLGAETPRACLERTWHAENYETKQLEWFVGGRRVYDVWDASARWGVFGGPVAETPAGAHWRADVLSCGYRLLWPDKVG